MRADGNCAIEKMLPLLQLMGMIILVQYYEPSLEWEFPLSHPHLVNVSSEEKCLVPPDQISSNHSPLKLVIFLIISAIHHIALDMNGLICTIALSTVRGLPIVSILKFVTGPLLL